MDPESPSPSRSRHARREPRRRSRWLALLLLLLMGFSVPFSVWWTMERTERRIRATERMLLEELALLRAEVAALSEQQRVSQEAVEELSLRTDALLERWQEAPSAAEAESPEADGEGEKDVPFWIAGWAGAAYYVMKAGQYLPALYQLARLHPAVP